MSRRQTPATEKPAPTRKAFALTRRRAEEGPAISEQARWTGGQARLTTIIRWAMLAGVASGLISLILLVSGAVTPTPAPASIRPAPTADPAEQSRAGELAVQLVVTWLQASRGDEKALQPYVATDRLRLPDTQSFIASEASVASIEMAARLPANLAQHMTTDRTRAAAASPTTPHTWTVTVGATVRGIDEQPSAATRRYYRVPVVITNGAARAAALPAPTAAPATGADLDLGYRYQLSSDHPIWTTVGEFLTDLTTGTGDVSRYTAPGTTIRPITPAPYTAVDLLELRTNRDFTAPGAHTAPPDGTSTRVLVTAEMTAGGGTADHTLTGQWALTLTARAGRWEISAIDPAPLLSTQASGPVLEGPQQPATAATTTATTTPSSTTPSPTTTSTPPPSSGR